MSDTAEQVVALVSVHQRDTEQIAIVQQPVAELVLGVARSSQRPSEVPKPIGAACMPKPVASCFCAVETLHD